MLNQLKEVLCIYVLFQESRVSVKEEPEMNVFMTCFYHIGAHFQG